jgi:hypothetical protein
MLDNDIGSLGLEATAGDYIILPACHLNDGVEFNVLQYKLVVFFVM